MQLGNLVKPLDSMSDEELMEHVRAMRHRRDTLKPASAKRVERVEKKASQKKVSAVEKLLDGLSAEEKLKLLEQLGGM